MVDANTGQLHFATFENIFELDICVLKAQKNVQKNNKSVTSDVTVVDQDYSFNIDPLQNSLEILRSHITKPENRHVGRQLTNTHRSIRTVIKTLKNFTSQRNVQ